MNPGWFNLILFLVLAAVIILCSFNVATYSDIKNGNTNAPDITDSECTAMIIINSILLVAASLTLIYYLYKAYQGAIEVYESRFDFVGSDVVAYTGPNRPNNLFTQMFLWLFGTFAFVTSIFNLINATKLNNSDANNAVSTSGAFLAFSWILLAITLGNFIYVTFRTFVPKKLEEQSIFTLTSLFGKSLKTKPTVPSLMVGECKGKVNINDFNKFLTGTLKVDKFKVPENGSRSNY